MPLSIRLGIRMIYRNKLSKVRKGLDTKVSRSILQKLTMRQGRKYNDPKSQQSIKRKSAFANKKKKKKKKKRGILNTNKQTNQINQIIIIIIIIIIKS